MRVKLCLFLILTAAAPAHAYIGPGLGAGTVGVVLGLLTSVLLAIIAVFWYPLKRMLKRWVSVKDGDSEAVTVDEKSADIADSETDESVAGRLDSSL